MLIPSHALVVVADGAKLLLLRNIGDAAAPKLACETKQILENPPDHDQKSDLAGQAASPRLASGNHAMPRSSMEEPDYHRLAEDRFASEIADVLRRAALDDEFKSLVIVAPPRTLGEMRKHYHKTVIDRLIAEVPKDLTGLPLAEIERSLADV